VNYLIASGQGLRLNGCVWPAGVVFDRVGREQIQVNRAPKDVVKAEQGGHQLTWELANRLAVVPPEKMRVRVQRAGKERRRPTWRDPLRAWPGRDLELVNLWRSQVKLPDISAQNWADGESQVGAHRKW